MVNLDRPRPPSTTPYSTAWFTMGGRPALSTHCRPTGRGPQWSRTASSAACAAADREARGTPGDSLPARKARGPRRLEYGHPTARSRARDRDARLRAHRRGPQRGVRRLQRRIAARSHQRLAVRAAGYRRRRLSPRHRSCRSSRWRTKRSSGTPSIRHVVVVQRQARAGRRSRCTCRRAAITGTTA